MYIGSLYPNLDRLALQGQPNDLPSALMKPWAQMISEPTCMSRTIKEA